MDKELYTQIYQIEKTHWWYVARREIIFEWLYQRLGSKEKQNILDVGCGTGFNIDYLQERGSHLIVGLDISMDALSFCKERNLFNIICGDGALIPIADETFDIILALDLLEHLENDHQAIQEFVRTLKPGGSLFLFVPAYHFLWGLQDVIGHHYRRYTTQEIRNKISQSNLKIIKLSYVNTFLFPLIWIGRIGLKFFGNLINVVSENDLHPGWSNGALKKIFSAEKRLLHRLNFPFGVSILCIAQKIYND